MGLGFVQFGFVAIYLSESFIRGFMTAAGLQILISVLKYIFGLTVPSYAGPGSIVFVSLRSTSCAWSGVCADTGVAITVLRSCELLLMGCSQARARGPIVQRGFQEGPTLEGRVKYMTLRAR